MEVVGRRSGCRCAPDKFAQEEGLLARLGESADNRKPETPHCQNPKLQQSPVSPPLNPLANAQPPLCAGPPEPAFSGSTDSPTAPASLPCLLCFVLFFASRL